MPLENRKFTMIKYEVRRVRNLLMAGNATMPRWVGVYNLPALQTCKPSIWCRKHCYALHGKFTISNVKLAHQWRLEQSKRPDFVKRMIAEIRKRYFKYIRIHISGDFYSVGYVKKWAKIAQAFPRIIFRTNTKRTDLLRHMLSEFPDNIVVRESLDITRDIAWIYPAAAIIGTPHSGNYFTCIDDCEKCKFHCWHNSDINVVTSQIR